MGRVIYTIGYSGYNNDVSLFIEAVRERNIDVVVDVRSDPHSAHFDQFNREKLALTLGQQGIAYRNYASEFGAKQLDKSYYSRFDGLDERIDSFRYFLTDCRRYESFCLL